jgi:23S rRNA (guanine745-N1)-methyltransferase
MIEDVLGFLRCPQCGEDGGLSRSGGALRCPAGHSFDIARAGYVSLLPSGAAKNTGDTSAMIAARQSFLRAGHFAGLAAALADTATASAGPPAEVPGCVVDLGAGTGYYLAAVLDRLPSRAGLALDISKSALRVAARAHPRAVAIGADAWRPLPVRDAAADLVLNVFAPRAGAQAHRILRRTGRLIVVTPAPTHLAELAGPLGLLSVDARKEERLASKLAPYFSRTSRTDYSATLSLDHESLAALACMGPSFWHTDQDTLTSAIGRLPETFDVTIAARIGIYRKR